MSLRVLPSKLKAPVIPKRIPRSKTDILKALSMTVGLDSTAPEYRYIDDPRLMPTSSYQRLTYSLAKESGLKAAKYFLEKYPHCFYRDQSEPKVEAFTYKEVYDATMDLEEEDLKDAIDKCQVSNAEIAYKTITKKGGEISDETKKELIQLLLFCGSVDPPDPDLRERSEEEVPLADPGLTPEIFDSIKDKDSAAYSSMIVGLLKIGLLDRAKFLVREASNQNIPLTVEAYNALLSLYDRDFSRQERWDKIISMLKTMAENNVSPNVETFNNVLTGLKAIGFPQQTAQTLARRVMAEMKECGIEPSLFTYKKLMEIFCTGPNPSRMVFEEILHAVEGKPLVAKTPKDTTFFDFAMSLCLNNFTDVSLAYKVHSICTQHENFLLLDCVFNNRRKYYENFFTLMLRTEVIDNVMQVYDKYVPNIYIPSCNLLIETVEKVNLYQAYQYLPQLCSDFLMFDYKVKDEWIVEFVSRLISKGDREENINKHLSEFAAAIIDEIQSRAERKIKTRHPLDARIYPYCLNLLLNAKDYEKAQKLVMRMSNEKSNMTGQPPLDDLVRFVENVFAYGTTTRHLKEAVAFACFFRDSSVLRKALEVCRKHNLPESFVSSLHEIASNHHMPIPAMDQASKKDSSEIGR